MSVARWVAGRFERLSQSRPSPRIEKDSPVLRPNPATVRRGHVIALFCILLVFLVGMVAFAIDTGFVAATRTQLQATSDSGALAGVEKLNTWPGQEVPEASARAEARRFVGLNDSLTVRDVDMRLLRYNPLKPSGQRISTAYSIISPPNAFEITLRRDTLANGRVSLFFAPVLGQGDADVRTKATAYILPAKGIKPGAPMIPYTMQIDYYFACLGEERRGVDNKKITVADDYTVQPDGLVVAGPDGVSECVLFSSTQNKPGNFGSLDIGSTSNGTPELDRQIANGPTTGDFNDPDFYQKIAADGALYTPVNVTGDTGLSTSTKHQFELIFGEPRLIPLYDTVTGTGNAATSHTVAYAAITVLTVDFNGTPKRLWIQPSKVTTNKVTAGDIDSVVSYGVFTPPKLVVP